MTQFKDYSSFPEVKTEQTEDGAFRRQSNFFRGRFGSAQGQNPVEKDRYRLLVSTGCGWSRRILIIRRLLNLEDAISVGYTTGRSDDGWHFSGSEGGVDEVFQVPFLNDLYRNTNPNYVGRGTVPTVADTTNAQVVSNDYHALGYELATVWKPLHGPKAIDLFPEDLRTQITLLNQQLFDDVNNGPYKALFATSVEAGQVALGVFEARLRDLDYRLATRRYLFGERITLSDVHLFQTLLSFDTNYRPGITKNYGDDIIRITDLPNLWDYARDLFATEGFVDDRELISTGIIPRDDSTWENGFAQDPTAEEAAQRLARWQEPVDRSHLTGSVLTSGPGGAGTDIYWSYNFQG